MTTAPAEHGTRAPYYDRRFPPIHMVSVFSMMLALTSAIYLASYLPRRAPLGPAVGMVIAAGVLLLANMVTLSRLRDFAWDKFFLVAGWTLLAYLIIAGMLEYTFIRDQTRGAPLLLMTLTLGIFAVDIPVLLGFSVARYQQVLGKRPLAVGDEHPEGDGRHGDEVPG